MAGWRLGGYSAAYSSTTPLRRFVYMVVIDVRVEAKVLPLSVDQTLAVRPLLRPPPQPWQVRQPMMAEKTAVKMRRGADEWSA